MAPHTSVAEDLVAGIEQRLVGAALPIHALKDHLEWLRSGARDLEIQDPAMPAVLDGDWKSLVREAKGLLAGFEGRLGIHGPFLGFSLVAGFDPKIGRVVAERLRTALEFAAELGASHMVIHSPFISFSSNPFALEVGPKGMFDEKAYSHVILDGLVEFAREIGCILVIENIQDTNPAPLLDLVKSFESDTVRMSLDVGHALITHKLGGPTPDQWVRDSGSLLAHLHLQDGDGQADRHWAPGDGNVNWYALFEALAQNGGEPRLILELRDHRGIERGAAWLAGRGHIR